jgi:uncharacterized membrane protein YqjE
MDEGTESPNGLLASLRRLLDMGLDLAQNRLELLSVELQEEKHRLIEVLVLTFTTVALGLMALIVISFTIVVLFWENGRLPVLIILSVSYIAATVWASFRLRALVRNGPPPLRDSLEELTKDRECLQPKR